MLDQVQGLPGRIGFVVLVDELLVVRRTVGLDVSVLEGDDDVEAYVLLPVASPLAQLVLLDVVDHLFGSQKPGQLEDLVDLIVSHEERCLLENLLEKEGTIPAKIMPAAQQSTR